MSLEQLLFLLLLVAIPLLERLIRGMRGRTGGTPPEGAPAPAEPPVSRPRVPVSVPDAGATASQRHGTDFPTTSERGPQMRRERKDGKTTSVGARHPDRSAAVQRYIARGDLRRAIVLMAVLGPCRALEPKDAAQLG